MVLAAGQQDRLWVGHDYCHLHVLETNGWRSVAAWPSIDAIGSITALYEDRQDRRWVGTGRGVLCQDQEDWTFYSTTNGLSHTDVRVIYQDRRDDIWFGTYGGGLNRLHEGRITSYATQLGKLNNRAWWIH